jgi:hypothetical protein
MLFREMTAVDFENHRIRYVNNVKYIVLRQVISIQTTDA